MPKSTVLTILVALAFMPVVEGATYKWVDSEGGVHFSDVPPQESTFERVPRPRFSAPDNKVRQRMEKLLESQGEAREAQQIKNEEQQKQAIEKAERDERCRRAQEQLTQLETLPPRRLAITDDDGVRRRLTEDEHRTRLAKLRERMPELCGG